MFKKPKSFSLISFSKKVNDFPLLEITKCKWFRTFMHVLLNFYIWSINVNMNKEDERWIEIILIFPGAIINIFPEQIGVCRVVWLLTVQLF